MRYAVHVICRPEVASGFALAGLRIVEATTREEGASRLLQLASQSESGVILVEDRFYGGLSADIQRAMGRRPLPMIVPFPGPAWAESAVAAETYIVEILRQAIGYSVRLR